jgi:hypothetical protein
MLQMARQRQDDPNNWDNDNLFGIVNNYSQGALQSTAPIPPLRRLNAIAKGSKLDDTKPRMTPHLDSGNYAKGLTHSNDHLKPSFAFEIR